MCHPEVPEGVNPPAVRQEEVSIPLPDGARMPALIAHPEAAVAPGVLVVADVFGRSPFYELLSARLATAGFTAMLPEFFFRQGPLAERTREAAFARRALLDETQALQDLDAALDHLTELAPGERVGTVGFCMGGTFVLDLAAKREDLATVCYYGFPAGSRQAGANNAPAPLDLLDAIRGPILAFWGDQDQGVGLDNVRRLAGGLSERRVEFSHHVYPGVGHGFMSASNLDPEHRAYQAACDSWTRALEFLRSRLAPATTVA